MAQLLRFSVEVTAGPAVEPAQRCVFPPNDIPCIVLTGDLPTVLRRSGTALAACRFLPKRVDTQALLDSISELRTPRGNLLRSAVP